MWVSRRSFHVPFLLTLTCLGIPAVSNAQDARLRDSLGLDSAISTVGKRAALRVWLSDTASARVTAWAGRFFSLGPDELHLLQGRGSLAIPRDRIQLIEVEHSEAGIGFMYGAVFGAGLGAYGGYRAAGALGGTGSDLGVSALVGGALGALVVGGLVSLVVMAASVRWEHVWSRGVPKLSPPETLQDLRSSLLPEPGLARRVDGLRP